MQSFLRSFLLLLCHQLTKTILKRDSPIQKKTEALRVLIGLLGLVGPKNLAAIRVKVLVILRQSLREDALVPLACRAWDVFVRAADPPLLRTLVPHVVANLLPQLEKHEREVVATLEYVIVHNRAILRGYLQDIYELPDIPALANVNAVLKVCVCVCGCVAVVCLLKLYEWSYVHTYIVVVSFHFCPLML